MVPVLAKQALARKCAFDNAKMTGNDECAYALGVVAGALDIPKPDNIDNMVSLKESVEALYNNRNTDSKQINKIISLLADYEPSEQFDEQMAGLFNDGYEDRKIKF